MEQKVKCEFPFFQIVKSPLSYLNRFFAGVSFILNIVNAFIFGVTIYAIFEYKLAQPLSL